MTATRRRVLSIYRRLLRQQATTFANDAFMQRNARSEIRSHFAQRRALTDAQQIDEAILAAQDAADYLRTSVIQAKHVQGGHFGAFQPFHVRCL